jgi:hypothetical protein
MEMGIFFLFMIREFITRILATIYRGLKAYAHMRRSMHIAAYLAVVVIEFSALTFVHDEMTHYYIMTGILTHEGIPLMFAD